MRTANGSATSAFCVKLTRQKRAPLDIVARLNLPRASRRRAESRPRPRGRICLCNALLANIGHAQVRPDGKIEPPLVTVGDDLNTIVQFLAPGRESYSAAEVIESMLGDETATDAHKTQITVNAV